MNRRNSYSPEVQERAVRLFYSTLHERTSRWAAIQSVAVKIGCTPETLRHRSLTDTPFSFRLRVASFWLSHNRGVRIKFSSVLDCYPTRRVNTNRILVNFVCLLTFFWCNRQYDYLDRNKSPRVKQ